MSEPNSAGMGRSRRADAELNRARILAAAQGLISGEVDLGSIHMRDIARASGLGQATLYRHFATREDLLLEIYRDDVERLLALAESLRSEKDGVTALTLWLKALIGYGHLRSGLAEVIKAAARDAVRQEWRPRMLAALDSLLQAAQQESSIRRDVTAEDVWELLAFLWSDSSGARDQAHTERLLDILLDGLRTTS